MKLFLWRSVDQSERRKEVFKLYSLGHLSARSLSAFGQTLIRAGALRETRTHYFCLDLIKVARRRTFGEIWGTLLGQKKVQNVLSPKTVTGCVDVMKWGNWSRFFFGFKSSSQFLFWYWLYLRVIGVLLFRTEFRASVSVINGRCCHWGHTASFYLHFYCFLCVLLLLFFLSAHLPVSLSTSH